MMCNLFFTSTYLQTKLSLAIFFHIFTDKNEVSFPCLIMHMPIILHLKL